MKRNHMILGALVLSTTFLFNIPAVRAQAADNTKVNERDQPRKEVTADQQSETEKDRDITQRIRKAIENDKSLSTYAHNVKIIASGGIVTLKGPVKSEEEKKAVEQKATQIAGNGKIRSEIEIVPEKKKN
jgi:hyperosmotically inducible periplasmic protein